MHMFNMNFIFHFYYILGFERALDLKSWNVTALQNETHMRASILNTGLCPKTNIPVTVTDPLKNPSSLHFNVHAWMGLPL